MARRKTGGRQKGSKNKATLLREQQGAMDEAEARRIAGKDLSPEVIRGMSPKQVMLHCMVSDALEGKWESAGRWAEKVAPYVDPKLATTTLNANVNFLDQLSLGQQRALAAALAAAGGDEEGAGEGSQSTHH